MNCGAILTNDMEIKENILMLSIMATVKNIPKYTEDDVTEIIHMINIIEKAHQDLLQKGDQQFNNSINNRRKNAG